MNRYNYFKVGTIVAVMIIGISIGIFNKVELKSNIKQDTMRFESSLALFSEEDMSAMASLIVRGKVFEIEPSKWNTQDGNEPSSIGFKDAVYHEVLINADKTYKGSLNSKEPIRVRVYGGEIPNGKTIKKYIDDASANFSKGEDVILFLGYDDTPWNRLSQSDYYILTGSKQGKYNVSGEKVSNVMHGDKNITDLAGIIEKNKNNEPKIKKVMETFKTLNIKILNSKKAGYMLY